MTMAYTSKSGEKFTNLSQARAADRKFGAVPVPGKAVGDGRQPVARFSTPEAPRADTAQPTHAQIVEEHGPAKSVTILHDSDNHKVSSTHDDGHTHESNHESAADAHSAASILAGVADGDNE